MPSVRTRKLSMWRALPPYIGGKRRLCPVIFREIDRILPRRFWSGLVFLDGFLGAGAVSLYAKAQGFKVIATDIADRAIVVGQALIANSRVRLTREDVLRLAAPTDDPPGRIEQNYAPTTFTRAQARLLDRALAQAALSHDSAKAALLRLMAIRIALLVHPMSQVRRGTMRRVSEGEFEAISTSYATHYVESFRLTRPERLWSLAQEINRGVIAGEASVMQVSVLDALPEIQADVAYFDPPYAATTAYEEEYKVIDEILQGQALVTSPFSAKDGANLLDDLFERAQHIPIWVLSMGNAVVSLEELEGKMARFGRATRAIAIKYAHLAALSKREKRDRNREFLVIGWNLQAPRLRNLPGVRSTMERSHEQHELGITADETR